ncbi:nucleoside diphosphate kinase, partial [Apiospora arundinis]
THVGAAVGAAGAAQDQDDGLHVLDGTGTLKSRPNRVASAAASASSGVSSSRSGSSSSPANTRRLYPENYPPPPAEELDLPRHRPRAIWLPLFFTAGFALIFLLFLPPWHLYDQGLFGLNSFSFVSSPSCPSSSCLPSTTTTTVTSYHTPLSTSSSTEEIPKQKPNMSTERTFIAIKPDGVQRGLVGPILSRFENRGYKLVAIKLMTPGKAHLEKHYADLAGKPFFPGLIEYMNSGPICAMVWEGRDAVKTGRVLLGATNPLASAPGTIRGDFAIDVGRNVCHGSDSVENAEKEIALWFKPEDLVSYKSATFDWVYEKA